MVLVVSGAINWRYLAGALLLMFGVVGILGVMHGNIYAFAGYDSFGAIVSEAVDGVGTRLAVPHIPSFLPSGVAEHPGAHNIGLRLAIENGVQAAMLWMAITGWALWKRPRTVAWWVLLSIVLLGQLDYYSFQGHLGGFWWLTVGILTKPYLARPNHDLPDQIPPELTSPLHTPKGSTS